MDVSRKAICALKANEEEIETICATVLAFEDACNYLSKVAFQKRTADPRALHDLAYRDLRAIFRLPASLAVQVINKVASSYSERPYKFHTFSERSIILDGKLFCLKRNKGLRASMATVKGRVKARLEAGSYQRKILENPVQSARIVLKRDIPYVHIYVTCKVPEKETDDPVGVDLGVRKLLVASNGFKINGGLVKSRQRHFRYLRESLKSKGTSSARRRLKRLKKRENQWMKTVLHQSSRALIESLEEGNYVVLERLYGTKIRSKAKRNRKCARRVHKFSAMGRLQHMITYKCEERGVPVVLVKPDFTSQRCPRCGTIDRCNRRTQALFRCVNCKYQHNADFVASINLRELARGGWAAVSQPYAIPTTDGNCKPVQQFFALNILGS